MSSSEWETYKISDQNSGVLSTVRHIVHLPVARRIIEDGKIKAGLVHDKSRLNKSRISVSWLSANEWGPGSLYGTVGFQFEWEKLIKYKRIYWVEAMASYHPHAYRFLLTFEEITSPLVAKYDPEHNDGPLRFKDGKWLWNTQFTSEFMIADDLIVSQSAGIEFVPHHQKYCRTHTNCSEKIANPQPPTTAGKLLAYILAHRVHDLDAHMQPDAGGRNRILDLASSWLWLVIDHVKYNGPLGKDAECDSVIKGAFALFGVDKVEDGKNLLGLIASKAEAHQALIRLIQSHFDIPTWSVLDD